MGCAGQLGTLRVYLWLSLESVRPIRVVYRVETGRRWALPDVTGCHPPRATGPLASVGVTEN